MVRMGWIPLRDLLRCRPDVICRRPALPFLLPQLAVIGVPPCTAAGERARRTHPGAP